MTTWKWHKSTCNEYRIHPNKAEQLYACDCTRTIRLHFACMKNHAVHLIVSERWQSMMSLESFMFEFIIILYSLSVNYPSGTQSTPNQLPRRPEIIYTFRCIVLDRWSAFSRRIERFLSLSLPPGESGRVKASKYIPKGERKKNIRMNNALAIRVFLFTVQ